MGPCDEATGSLCSCRTHVHCRSSAEILDRTLHNALPQHQPGSSSISPSLLPLLLAKYLAGKNTTCPEFAPFSHVLGAIPCSAVQRVGTANPRRIGQISSSCNSAQLDARGRIPFQSPVVFETGDACQKDCGDCFRKSLIPWIAVANLLMGQNDKV